MDRWGAAWRVAGRPAGRPPTGAEVRAVLAALAKESNRDAAEVVRAVRERLAVQLAGDEQSLAEAQDEAERLVAGLRADREGAAGGGAQGGSGRSGAGGGLCR